MSNRFDPRAVLATVAVLSAFALQGYITFACHGGSATSINPPACDSTMPPWVVGLVSAIVAFYFGARSADSHNGNGDNHGGSGGR